MTLNLPITNIAPLQLLNQQQAMTEAPLSVMGLSSNGPISNSSSVIGNPVSSYTIKTADNVQNSPLLNLHASEKHLQLDF
jgi:hypothetical protein